MSLRRRSIARAMLQLCGRLLPEHRKAWADAMMAEMEAIADETAALRFAIGCTFASVNVLVLTAGFLALSLRIGSIAGMATLAVGAAAIAWQLSSDDAHNAAVFAVIALMFGCTGSLYLRFGPVALIRTARVLLPAYIAAYLLVQITSGSGRSAKDTVLHSALALEGIAIWSALFLAAHFVARQEASRLEGGA